MKLITNHPFLVYIAASIGCLAIMVLVDYLLGAEAEHLNAWVIINRLAGNPTTIGDSKAIEFFGLTGAALVMLVVNTALGAILVQTYKLAVRLLNTWGC